MGADFSEGVSYNSNVDKIDKPKVNINDVNNEFKNYVEINKESITYDDITNFYKEKGFQPVGIAIGDIGTGKNKFFSKYKKDGILYKYENLKLIELKKEGNLFIDGKNFFNENAELCDKNGKTERIFRNEIDEYFENIFNYEIDYSYGTYKYMSGGNSCDFAKEGIFYFEGGEPVISIKRKEYTLNQFKEYLVDSFKKTWEGNLNRKTIGKLEEEGFQFSGVNMTFPDGKNGYTDNEKSFIGEVAITDPTPKNISFKKETNKYIFTLDFGEGEPTILEVY